jgi:hypothetical protein
MGVGYSGWNYVPLYQRSTSEQRNYDHWGFIPSGFKPSQHVWHTYYSDAQGAQRLNAPKEDDNRPMAEKYGIVDSLTEGIYAAEMRQTKDVPWSGTNLSAPVEGNVWPNYEEMVEHPQYDWWTQWELQQKYNGNAEPGALCNPMNFPNCTMAPITKSMPQFRDYLGELHVGEELYVDTIDKLYKDFYLANDLNVFKSEINTTDPSDYDPCADPGFLAQMGPIILGGLTGGLFQKLFAPDLRNTLSNQSMIAWSVGTFAFGLFYMRAAMDVYGPEQQNMTLAGLSLSLPAGFTFGDYLINQGTFYNAQPNTIYAGSLLGFGLLVNPALVGILRLPAPITFVLHLVGGVLNFLSTAWCKMTAQLNACTATDKDGGLLYPDARIWDAPSIAAMLTEEVRAQEGWSKDDPRTEFAFNAFLTGPAILDAARPANSTNPALKALFQRRGHGNPFGSIYGVRAEQQEGPLIPDGHKMKYGGSASYAGWDGAEQAWDLSNHNVYACQNWDSLRNNLMTNPNQESQQLKVTFDEWTKAVRDAANVHTNIRHAGIGHDSSGIPGWKGGAGTLTGLLKTLSQTEWNAFIMQVYEAPSMQERYALVANLNATTILPKDEAQSLWINGNELAYTFLQLKSGKTAADVWAYMQTWQMQSLQARSAMLYAMSATTSPELYAFWDAAPEEMKTAAKAFDPPAGLPYGFTPPIVSKPINLPPPKEHWHWAIGMNPPQDSGSACDVFLQKLRGQREFQQMPIASWARSCSQMVDMEINCKLCSKAQMCTIFAYFLAFSSYDVGGGGAGVGYVVAELEKLGWSDNSIGAALLELQTPIGGNQTPIAEWMKEPMFWARGMWGGKSYTDKVFELLKNDHYYDETANVCAQLTPFDPLQPPPPQDPISYPIPGTLKHLDLIPLHYTPPPPEPPISYPIPGLLKWLQHNLTPLPPPPPQKVPGALKGLTWPGLLEPTSPWGQVPLQPVPPDGDICEALLESWRNPTPANYNLPLNTWVTMANTMSPANACSQCHLATFAEVVVYGQVAYQGVQTPQWGVAYFLGNNQSTGWSDSSLSAALHALKRPLNNQAPMSEWIATFFTLVQFQGKDWTSYIEHLLSLPGEFDASTGLC